MKAFDNIIAYLRSSKEEVKKVSWPSRKDTMRYSTLVIGASVCIALFFAALDTGFTEAVSVLLTRRSQPVNSQPQTPITPDLSTVSTSQPTINFDNVQPITTTPPPAAPTTPTKK